MVRLLRSYEKQISINAMKKIRAPLLGLAKYIYYIGYWKLLENVYKPNRKSLLLFCFYLFVCIFPVTWQIINS